VLSPFGFEWRKALINKRLAGYANLVRQRGRVYRREYLMTVLRAAVAQADQLVVTGDITNMSFDHEFDEAQKLLDEAAKSIEVTVVPGNHDVYVPSIVESRRFPRHFHQFMRSDLPDLACDLPTGMYPCVKLRGPAAIIALSDGVPLPPFVSSGRLGELQLRALDAVLAHPEVQRRTAVVLVHHPPFDKCCRVEQLRDGLADAAELRAAFAPLRRGLVLYGHVHYRSRKRLSTTAGALDVISASGAALDHKSPGVRAGYNLYAIADDGSLASADAYVVSADGKSMEQVGIP